MIDFRGAMQRLTSILICTTLLSLPTLAIAEESVGSSPRRWGGTLSLNFPHPIFLEGEYRPQPPFSFGLGLGGLSLKNLKFGSSPVDLGVGAIDIKGRWHPFGGAFFLGLGLGYQTLSGRMTSTIQATDTGGTTRSIETNIDLAIGSPYLTPHLDWYWTFGTGFVLGFDLGWQIPIAPRTSFDITTNNNIANVAISIIQATQQYKDLEADIQKVGNALGRQSLPMVTVIRVGWMF
jgi:hypothetical protein